MRKLYQIPIYFLVLLFILFEDLIWRKIAEPIANLFKKIEFFHFVEVKVLANMNSYSVLALFLSLFIVVEILGIVAIALIGKGLLVSGILLYVGKIPVASFAFWIFKVSKEKLLVISWFNKIYLLVVKFIEFVKNTSYYNNSIDFYHKLKALFKSEKELFLLKFAKAIYKKERS